MIASTSEIMKKVQSSIIRSDIPDFRTGDTLKVHIKIREGNKERIQVFEGVVIKRHSTNKPDATFTVRKISFIVGVESTFLVHSPRVEKIEVVTKGKVRRARLYYLRPLRGKAASIQRDKEGTDGVTAAAAEAKQA